MPIDIRQGPGDNPHTVSERLYLTRGRERVVREGDPDAFELYATPGMEIPAAEAERYGLTPEAVKSDGPAEPEPALGDDLPAAGETPEPDSEPQKAVRPKSDKARHAPAEDK